MSLVERKSEKKEKKRNVKKRNNLSQHDTTVRMTIGLIDIIKHMIIN
jgi:hypothetical protein